MEKQSDFGLETQNPITQFEARLQKREEQHGLTDPEVPSLSREEIYRRLDITIGKTPMRRIELPNDNVLLQKDETRNPAESHYDRCYLRLMRELEVEGTIKPGDIILETTSGSAGISFSWICKKLGYKSVVFMPSFVPKPRIIEIQRLATQVVLSDDKERYITACAEDMMQFLRENRDKAKAAGKKIWSANHSHDFRTPRAFRDIAEEIHADTNGEGIDYFIGGIGNGSTLLGIGERAKELWPNMKVVAFEPKNACPYFKADSKKWGSIAPSLIESAEIPDGFSFHSLPGTGGFGTIPFPFMDRALENGIIDDVCVVPDEEILRMARYNDSLSPEDQLGHTSTVSRFIAERMAEQVSGKTFLTLAYDKADRYGEAKYTK